MAEQKPDRLSALIQQFRIEARAPSAGPADIPNGPGLQASANLFVIGQGRLSFSADGMPAWEGEAPLLVFFPRGTPRGLRLIERSAGAEYVYASVDAGGDSNPIAQALPDMVTVSLDQSKQLTAVTDILLDEALAPRCGGGAVINRLCEIVVIRLLRHLIEAGETRVGLVAGLAHANLSRAIVAIHNNPARNWRLEDLADVAAVSRTQFANTFRNVVGVTPGEYLSGWRLTLARIEMARGVPLKLVAKKVGFSGSAALSRAYTRRYGISPRQDRVRAA